MPASERRCPAQCRRQLGPAVGGSWGIPCHPPQRPRAGWGSTWDQGRVLMAAGMLISSMLHGRQQGSNHRQDWCLLCGLSALDQVPTLIDQCHPAVPYLMACTRRFQAVTIIEVCQACPSIEVCQVCPGLSIAAMGGAGPHAVHNACLCVSAYSQCLSTTTTKASGWHHMRVEQR